MKKWYLRNAAYILLQLLFGLGMLDTKQEGANKPPDFLNLLCGNCRTLKSVRKVWVMFCDMAAKDAVKRETRPPKHLNLELISHVLQWWAPEQNTKPYVRGKIWNADNLFVLLTNITKDKGIEIHKRDWDI